MRFQKKSIIDSLEILSFVMDRLLLFPGTKLRFGINSLLLLIPVFGDALPSLISFGLVLTGLVNYRVPRIVALHMVLNSLIDSAISWIPVVGNVWDVYFKADTRNVRLLQKYMLPFAGDRSTTGDWVFVIAVFAAVFVFLAGFFWSLFWLAGLVFHG